MSTKKLILTGAAGALGTQLREPLSKLADTLVSTDQVEDLGRLYSNETYIKADLGDLTAMKAVCEGAENGGAFLGPLAMKRLLMIFSIPISLGSIMCGSGLSCGRSADCLCLLHPRGGHA